MAAIFCIGTFVHLKWMSKGQTSFVRSDYPNPFIFSDIIDKYPPFHLTLSTNITWHYGTRCVPLTQVFELLR